MTFYAHFALLLILMLACLGVWLYFERYKLWEDVRKPFGIAGLIWLVFELFYNL